MVTRFLFVVLFVFAVGGVLSSSAQAQFAPALTIHARLCPTNQVPDDIFATCHDTAAADIEFFLDGVAVGSTGADGNLVVNVAGGSGELSGGVPGEFARNFVYCSNNEYATIVVPFAEVEAGTGVTVPVAVDGVTCDWYIVPFDLRGESPTPTPDDNDVTQLPNTGAGDVGKSLPAGLYAAFAVALAALAGSVLTVGRKPR